MFQRGKMTLAASGAEVVACRRGRRGGAASECAREAERGRRLPQIGDRVEARAQGFGRRRRPGR